MAEEAVFETFEIKLYRASPVGPIVTTALLGVFFYGTFLLNLSMVTDLSALAQGDGGQAFLRLGFIFTLILCAAFGVTNFERLASLREREELTKLLPGVDFESPAYIRSLRIATVVGIVFGLTNVIFLVATEADWNILTFLTSAGAWFAATLPLMFAMLCRGVVRSVSAGRTMSRNVNEGLKVNLYRHQELAIFGKSAMRGTFVWLIFVGIISLFFTEGNSGGLTLPTLAISFFVAFYTFYKTMQPVRKKIRAAKEVELDVIRKRLEKARANLDDAKAVQEIPALVALEHRIETIRDWPIDLPTVAAIPLYILLPVATLIAGAFAESLIGSLFF